MTETTPESNGRRTDQDTPRASDRPKIVASYDYTDEEGTPLFRVDRYEPGFDGERKTFRQQRRTASGGWVNGLGDVRRVLYRLRDLVDDTNRRLVAIVEGEKDADNLAALGVLATTSPMGAGKWRPEYTELLSGRHVMILPDNDDPGRNHARQVAEALHGTAASIKIVELPDLPAKGDVSDWLAAGGTKEQLFQMARDAPLWQPMRKARDVRAVDGESAAHAYDIIREHFEQRYRFMFRRGRDLYSQSFGRPLKAQEVTYGAGRDLITKLAEARNAPRNKSGNVEENNLPQFFTTWARQVWADLVSDLPDEEQSAEVIGVAQEEFRATVRAALCSMETLGRRLEGGKERGKETVQERRSLIGWCILLTTAKQNRWVDIRDRRIWTRRDGGRLRIAVRVELFSQISNGRGLTQMTQNKFSRLCELYSVGTGKTADGKDLRVLGNRAVELAAEFLEDLLPHPDTDAEMPNSRAADNSARVREENGKAAQGAIGHGAA